MAETAMKVALITRATADESKRLLGWTAKPQRDVRDQKTVRGHPKKLHLVFHGPNAARRRFVEDQRDICLIDRLRQMLNASPAQATCRGSPLVVRDHGRSGQYKGAIGPSL